MEILLHTSNEHYKRHISSSHLKRAQQNQCFFFGIFVQRTNFCLRRWLPCPASATISAAHGLRFSNETLKWCPSDGLHISWVGAEGLMGINCLSFHPTIVNKNQLFHSLDIIFLDWEDIKLHWKRKKNWKAPSVSAKRPNKRLAWMLEDDGSDLLKYNH